VAKNVFGHEKFLAIEYQQVRPHKLAILPTFCQKPYYYRNLDCKEGPFLPIFSLQFNFFKYKLDFVKKVGRNAKTAPSTCGNALPTFKTAFGQVGKTAGQRPNFSAHFFSIF